MAVVSSDGVVGHVIDSWHGGAKVRVLTDPESAIAVRTIDASGDRHRAGTLRAALTSSSPTSTPAQKVPRSATS